MRKYFIPSLISSCFMLFICEIIITKPQLSIRSEKITSIVTFSEILSPFQLVDELCLVFGVNNNILVANIRGKELIIT